MIFAEFLNSMNSVNHEKSRNGMVTGSIATDTFPMAVIESTFSLLLLGRYLLPLTILNRYTYLLRGKIVTFTKGQYDAMSICQTFCPQGGSMWPWPTMHWTSMYRPPLYRASLPASDIKLVDLRTSLCRPPTSANIWWLAIRGGLSRRYLPYWNAFLFNLSCFI